MIVDISFIFDIIDTVESTVEKERKLEVERVPLVILTMAVLEINIGVGTVAARSTNVNE